MLILYLCSFVIIAVILSIHRKVCRKISSSVTSIATDFHGQVHFWCKFFVSYIYFWLERKRRGRNSLKIPLTRYWRAIFSTNQEWMIENPKKLEQEQILFSGSDQKENAIFIDLEANRRVQVFLRFQGTNYALPEVEQFHYSQGPTWFSAGGLRLENREPFRRWKINFRGYLSAQNKPEIRKFVNISAWWAAFSEVFDFSEDISLVSLAESAANSSRWITSLISLTRINQSHHYQQFGQIFGKIYVEGVTEVGEEILLRGTKIRQFGQFQLSKMADWMQSGDFYFQDGTCVHLAVTDICNWEAHFKYGWVVVPRGDILTIKSFDGAIFASNSGSLELLTDENHLLLAPLNQLEENDEKLNVFHKYSLNGHIGLGVRQVHRKENVGTNNVSIAEHDPAYVNLKGSGTVPKTCFYVIPLNHIGCKNQDISGGKASTLHRLTGLQLNFTVPPGICVTTHAYNEHLEKVGAASLLASLHSCAKNSEGENLAERAERLAHLITKGDIGHPLQTLIRSEMQRQFGFYWESTKEFAVRSSAVGEDGSELSTAGQLETFLYVSGLKETCNALKKCWASNFRKEVIEYRRQHGQSLVQSVAVVVQLMIKPDVAGVPFSEFRHFYMNVSSGVLFTQDPVSGDPEKMVINAYPGCGEAVVSGEVNTDMIVLKRNTHDSLKIVDKCAGSDEASQNVCLSDDLSEQLGYVGLTLEEGLGHHPQDIEWAIHNGQIYILQSRDITSLDVETEWDLLHEFDTGVTACTDWHTTANVGEALPEGMTPMALSLPILDAMIQYMFAQSHFQPFGHKYFKTTFLIYRNRIFMNILKGFYYDMCRMEDTTIPELSFMGHVLEDKRVKQEACYRIPDPGIMQGLLSLYYMIKVTFYDAAVSLKHAEDTYSDFQLLMDSEDPLDMLITIENNIHNWTEAWFDHVNTTMRCSMSYAIVAAFKPGQSWTPELIADVATLYSSCQSLVSADIPESLKNLARSISCDGKAEYFLNLEATAAVDWLNSAESGSSGEAFRVFLEKHGHRCPAEIDVGSIAWWQDPTRIIDNIKSLLQHMHDTTVPKTVYSIDETLNHLNSPIGRWTRFFLKWAIPKARQSVAAREFTKNLAIKVTDQFKRAFLKIGSKLHEKGYLPDPGLIFYLTFHEVSELILTRSGRLVAKAVRRKKLMPLQNGCVYPEIIHGQPKPIERQQNLLVCKTIKGTGVCQGYVEGTARVALTLADAKETKSGEILITHSTDISWSPYFPVIRGLVTELGGLLSHGAVVAREYGLPCLVGAADATISFQTGDSVVLDTTKGIIEKIQSDTV